MHYAIYDAGSGAVRMHGQTAQPETLDKELGPGELLFRGSVPYGTTHIKNGAPVTIVPQPTYQEQRRADYPSTGDQLDAVAELAEALLEQGMALPEKTREWLQRLQTVKANHPKSPL